MCAFVESDKQNVQIRPGKVVASAYSISESDICESTDKSSHENSYDDGKYISTAKELNINLENSDLDSNQKEKFLAFLGKNRNVFCKGFVRIRMLQKCL